MWRQPRTLAVALVLCAAMPLSAADVSPPPFKDFTFKRVGVPKAGAPRRITVQVEPTPEPPAPAANEATAEASAPSDVSTAYDWFWQKVSPDRAESGPGRLDSAITHLQTGGSVPTPRLNQLRDTVSRYQAEILLATVGTQVSPALVLSVIAIESSGNATAESSAGAQGLMQLIPATAARFDVSDPLDPAQNIKGGVAYLDWLMDRFEGDPILVLAAYNAGEGAVERHGGVPPYNETRGYVPKVLAAFSVARNLCNSPPELISDGCVFNL